MKKPDQIWSYHFIIRTHIYTCILVSSSVQISLRGNQPTNQQKTGNKNYRTDENGSLGE